MAIHSLFFEETMGTKDFDPQNLTSTTSPNPGSTLLDFQLNFLDAC